MTDAANTPALRTPLSGLQLIEASAGTGKTWTISGLYLRLLLERAAEVSSILVVTFTRAATAELRERIRGRIQGLLDVLQGRPNDDLLCRLLAERVSDPAQAQQRLALALSSFDEAAIYTFHGFCQRTLADHAFSSGSSVDCEIAPDLQEVLHAVAADFWRRRIESTAPSDPGEALHEALGLAWMAAEGKGFHSLQPWVKKYLPFGRVRILAPGGDTRAAVRAYADAWAQTRLAWRRWGTRVPDQILQIQGLNRQKYKRNLVPRWAAELDLLFQQTEPPLELPGAVLRFAASTLQEQSEGGPPADAFFGLADRLDQTCKAMGEAFINAWRRTRLEFLQMAGPEMAKRLAERNAQSYDDLLSKVSKALARDPEGHLIRALRRRYPYALIDEFQDTDPLQWSILRHLYEQGSGDGMAAFLVGDPKQAIYSFRGADVFAYLDATRSCAASIALDQNQRSTPGLVAAVNHLFANRPHAFLHDRIQFHEVVAANVDGPALTEQGQPDPAPLRLHFHPGENQKSSTKAAGLAWATEGVSLEISRLLAGGVELGSQALRAGDIAVLVNNHQQASAVRRGLALRGIAAAELSTESVFASPTAAQLERLLLAVCKPKDAASLRSALATDLLGWTAPDIAALDAADRSWDEVFDDFDELHQLWQEYGVLRMLRRAISEFAIAGSLARLADGERRLTDLLHLGELLHAEERHSPGMEATLVRLAGRRDEGAAGEDAQLRLESDNALVQIVTIHRSKGLEYPVTFLPFLWDVRMHTNEDDICAYHDADPPHAVVIDGGSPDFPDAQARARREELSERLRVAYVALTRAKNRCYVFTGALNGIECSALGWLIHGINGAQPGTRCPAPDVLKGQLLALCQNAGGVIRLQEAGDSGAKRAPPAERRQTLAVARLSRSIREGFSTTSFTALTQGNEPRASEVLADRDSVPTPLLETPAAPLSAAAGGRYGFPRGSQAGICLHAILEKMEFDLRPRQDPWVREQLRRAGYDLSWAAELQNWLLDVLRTPLRCPLTHALFALSDIPAAAQLREMAFHLSTRDLSPAQLAELANRQGLPVSSLAPVRLSGYLSGFIDLVFERDGRWYLVDYKSNWLGAERRDYEDEALSQAMMQGDYHLQYLLYVVAMHRWLGHRLADYDYDRHWGGVFYLFLRGMHGDAGAAAVQSGVYAGRPSKALIEGIDRLLSGTSHEREGQIS